MKENYRAIRNAPISSMALIFLLSACGDAVYSQTDFPSRVGEVREGMTQDQVISVLGPFVRTLSPDGDLPVCDTFMYNELLNAKFVHVWYLNGKVQAATDGHEAICAMP